MDSAPADLLFFGTSVDLNDDLRRTIRTEIDQIEQSTSIVSSQAKSEERSFGQLSKDLTRARNEMMEFQRGGSDYREEAMMNDEVLERLREEFKGEMGPHVAVIPGGGRGEEEEESEAYGSFGEEEKGADDMDGDGDGGGNHAGTGPTKRVYYSRGKFIARKKSQLKAQTFTIQSIQRDIEQIKKRHASTEEETDNILQVIQSRQLYATKASSEKAVEEKRRELEAECQRNRGVKEAIQAARAKSGGFAQMITDKFKEQTTERNAHTTQESATTTEIKQLEQTLRSLQAEEKQLDDIEAPLSGQLNVMIDEVAEAESLMQKAKNFEPALEEVQQETEQLQMEYQELSKQEADSKQALEEATACLAEAKKYAKMVEEEKLRNDKEESEVMEPALSKKANAIKEKEKLAEEAAETHRIVQENETMNQNNITAYEAKYSDLQQKLQDAKERLARAHSEYEDFQKKKTLEAESTSNELDTIRECSAQLEDATQVELQRLEEMKKQRVDHRVQATETRRSELSLLEDKRAYGLELTERVLEMIREAKGIEEEIRETEVILNEDVEDSMNVDNFEIVFELGNPEGNVDEKFGEVIHVVHGHHDYDDAQASLCGEAESPNVKRR